MKDNTTFLKMSCQDDQHQVTKGLMKKYNSDDQILDSSALCQKKMEQYMWITKGKKMHQEFYIQ